MPEEINRLVTDAISDVLWTPSLDGDENLLREGVAREKIENVGNIMLDSYEMLRDAIEADETRSRLGLLGKTYGVVTLHRPSNVDTSEALSQLVRALTEASAHAELVFVVHPRTRKRLEEFSLLASLKSSRAIHLVEPLGYIQFMNLVVGSSAVVTDSGGIQEETTYLGIPCMTLRENTERPITVSHGSNKLIKPAELSEQFQKALSGEWPRSRRPELWDGAAAQRCVASLRRRSAVQD